MQQKSIEAPALCRSPDISLNFPLGEQNPVRALNQLPQNCLVLLYAQGVGKWKGHNLVLKAPHLIIR